MLLLINIIGNRYKNNKLYAPETCIMILCTVPNI